MKKLFAIIACILASLTTHAQQEPGTFSITPKAGFTLSNLRGSDADDFHSKFDFTAGGEGIYQISDHTALSAGLMYTQQGASFSEGSFNYNLDYINLPIMFCYNASEESAIKIGIQLGYLLNSEAKTSVYGNSSKVKITDCCNKLDISIPIGISYSFDHLVTEFRYSLGLTRIFSDLSKEKEIYNIYDKKKDPKIYNSVVTVTVGYRFDL